MNAADIAFKSVRSYNTDVERTDTIAVAQLYQDIQQSCVRILSADGQARPLPSSLGDFLLQIAANLKEGQPVAILQDGAQVTTVEGARLLGVSRQFLIKLLERGDIPHHMVGTHRRIYTRDLLAYRMTRDSARRSILDDLTRSEAADGLYDLEPVSGREE